MQLSYINENFFDKDSFLFLKEKDIAMTIIELEEESEDDSKEHQIKENIFLISERSDNKSFDLGNLSFFKEY